MGGTVGRSAVDRATAVRLVPRLTAGRLSPISEGDRPLESVSPRPSTPSPLYPQHWNGRGGNGDGDERGSLGGNGYLWLGNPSSWVAKAAGSGRDRPSRSVLPGSRVPEPATRQNSRAALNREKTDPVPMGRKCPTPRRIPRRLQRTGSSGTDPGGWQDAWETDLPHAPPCPPTPASELSRSPAGHRFQPRMTTIYRADTRGDIVAIPTTAKGQAARAKGHTRNKETKKQETENRKQKNRKQEQNKKRKKLTKQNKRTEDPTGGRRAEGPTGLFFSAVVFLDGTAGAGSSPRGRQGRRLTAPRP